MTQPGLDIRNVSKRFGSFTALNDVSLSIEPGEFVSFLGPSGCGKTTLLRIIAGFERASDGEVILEDQSIQDIPAHKRNMGVVFQSYSLFPNMTAAQNVAFGLKLRGLGNAEIDAEVERMLGLVGLANKGGSYPAKMSGGQQQRVALARALAIKPKVLLLDEPLSALDAKVRVSLRDEIRIIQKELGITAIFVTHDQEEALSISDRIAVFSVGQIEQFGSAREIYGSPASAFVAQFVGDGNRFRAKVTSSGLEFFGTVVAAKTHKLPVGADVQVVIRPENTRFVPNHEATGSLAGVVIAQQFQGAQTRVIATLDRHQGTTEVVIADYPSNETVELLPGTRIELSFRKSAPLINELPAA